jgi:hypothetical protein
MSEKLLPCPFCGGEARTFEYDGANQATCGGKHIDCAGTDVVAPVAMWNRRTPAPEGEACPSCNGVRPEFCSNAFHLASPVVPAPEGEAWTARHIVFDGPPDHNGPRFIEVETPEGKSVNAGEWRQRPDNLWELVIASPVVPVGVSEADINELRVVCDTNQAATDDSRIVRADDLPIGVIRRILAALRPTDTGANHD